MDGNTSAEPERRITEIEEEPLLQQSQEEEDHSCSFPSTVSPKGDSSESTLVILSPTQACQEETNNQDQPSPTSFKNAKCSTLTESDTSFGEKEELGLEGNEVEFDSSIEKKVAYCELVSGSLESGYFDDKIESSGVKKGEIEWSVDGVKEVKEKGKYFVGSDCFETGMGLGFDNTKEFVMVKEIGGESSLEAKKQQLLEELQDGSIFKNQTNVDNNVDGFDTGVGISGRLKGSDESVKRSLKTEVIDHTVLIEPASVTKTGNGGCNTCEGQQKVTQIGEAQNRTIGVGEVRNDCETDRDQKKRKYSREEMEALRFANIAEQRKLWRDIYTGLGDDAVKGYKDLASSKHHKNASLNFNPWKHFGRKEPGIPGKESSEIVDGGLANMEGDGVQNADLWNPACSDSIEGDGADTVLEEEYDEEVDSDDDYASIQRPAFAVKGEPDFDSGPPEDGLEFLRRVRWEAAHIPKVKVAKLDRSRVNKEQTVYMPQIPNIAKCPEYLLPLKQWEDAFLVDFSELRLFLSQNDGSSTKISQKMQPAAIVLGNSSPQHAESVVVEKFNIHRTEADEVQSYEPTDISSAENAIDQPCMANVVTSSQIPTPEASCSDALCNYPTLSVILAMDCVARVSMLRKRIKLAETMDTLSKNDCVWLFSLCAAVDAPLDADTCAALRGLLRKCASLRASKSEHDDEVIMLNILATISGRYYGQSES
ncbi:SIP1 domain-containing protein [Salix suchowensis]|nr:SIP1 domain-containing protein [Salix suchowensis]